MQIGTVHHLGLYDKRLAFSYLKQQMGGKKKKKTLFIIININLMSHTQKNQ